MKADEENEHAQINEMCKIFIIRGENLADEVPS